nr:GspH/FimT family pseudopilin [uncultured Photobacterium sp.]
MSAIHFIHSQYRGNRGFTLLELIITVSVMMILIGAAVPSFSRIIEENKIKRLATEIEWLLVLAKSESVMRSKPVLVKSNKITSTPNAASDWVIEATVSGESTVISRVIGQQFSGLKIQRGFKSDTITFNPLTGRPNYNGNFSFSSGENKMVKVKVNNETGRLYICSEGGGYGYSKCS